MDKQKWLDLALATELVHGIYIFAIIFFGRLWLPDSVIDLILTIQTITQIIFLQCPLTVFSCYCGRQANPDFKIQPSLSCYLYTKFGRLVGIPIFVALIVVSVLCRKMRF